MLLIMNYLTTKTKVLILLSSKITLYNSSNTFIWKSSLWYESPHSEIMSIHKGYTRIWAGSWCRNSKLGSFACFYTFWDYNQENLTIIRKALFISICTKKENKHWLFNKKLPTHFTVTLLKFKFSIPRTHCLL